MTKLIRGMTDLTPVDRRILKVLTADGRASITEIAASIGASRTTVKTRLDRLIETGVIRRFTIDTAAEAQDEVRAMATIALQGSMSRAVIRALSSLAEVHALHSTNGAWDLVAEIATNDLASLDATLRKIREIPGVLNSETNLLLSRV